MTLVLAYDVPNDRRRRRLHERLLDHGVPVQYSVFELPERSLADVLTMLEKETRREDCVRIYRLCRVCRQRVTVLGVGQGSGIVCTDEEEPPDVIEVPPAAASPPAGERRALRKADDTRRVARPGPLEQGRVRPSSRLLALVCAMDNLNEAFLDVRANRGAAGSDRVTITAFDRRRAEQLLALQTHLLDGSYRPRPLRRVPIPKKDGSLRVLRIPAVRDRVAQQAVLRVIAPLWEREFESCSFAYRHGRSVRSAVAAIGRARDRGYEWVLEADIEHFFDEVDHELVMARFRELVADDAVARLVESWVTVPDDGADPTRAVSPRGLPQGSCISPLLSNVFLDEFDEQMLALGHHLVRYADDFVVVCGSQREARAAQADTERLLGQSGLRLKSEKTHVTSFTEGFRFLGYLFVGDMAVRSPAKE